MEAVEKIPERPKGDGTGAGDAAANLAIKGFVAVMESEDSLFTLLEPILASATNERATLRDFSGDVVLGFKQAEHGRRRDLQFALVERLIDLLQKAGSAEHLEAKLCLATKVQGQEGQPTNALHVRLAATGDSKEQAALRWGLGLAHLQQALLFTSRHLRQHLRLSAE